MSNELDTLTEGIKLSSDEDIDKYDDEDNEEESVCFDEDVEQGRENSAFSVEQNNNNQVAP